MKAILVMEMPENCAKCDFCSGYAIADFCQVPGVSIRTVSDYRPDNCPLKPVPERKNYGELDEEADEGELTFSYWSGWNACIDAIEGSKKDG